MYDTYKSDMKQSHKFIMKVQKQHKFQITYKIN